MQKIFKSHYSYSYPCAYNTNLLSVYLDILIDKEIIMIIYKNNKYNTLMLPKNECIYVCYKKL